MRRKTRQVMAGSVAIGGGAPLTVQSMLNAPTGDVEANLRQAQALQQVGCQILRVSLPTRESVRLVDAIKKETDMPLVADIHFDYKIALDAVAAGIDKIRLNPGNIGGEEKVCAVADACRERKVPIRIGVNAGSLEKDLLQRYGGPVPEALVESALRHAEMLQRHNFEDIVISLKASHVPTCVAAYRLLAARCDYPLHLGVTEAGVWQMGLVKNAMGIGALLLDGIGDTLRVSLTAEPAKEISAGYDILRAAGHPVPGPEIISCPTCGRTCIPVAEIAEQLGERLRHSKATLNVAVMGCVVNGIGEGKQADIGIAGGESGAVLFKKGERVRTLRGDYLQQLLDEIEEMTR